jgi:small conductance mechanosensitive channel
MKIFPTFACTTLLTLSALTYAQDAQTPEKNETIEAETGAERVVRIQKVIESDQARLTELKKDLEEREDSFKIQSANLTEREAGLKAMQTQLDDTADPGQAAELQAEIDAYTVKYELVKSLADLAFQAEKTVRDQIQTLEMKIGIDQQALDQLLGKTETPQVAEPPVSAPVPAPPAAQAPAQPAPLPGLIPGIPVAPATPGATPGTVQEILPETAEQIEARKEAQKARLEAERAEQAVLSFLERKAALQEQIDLEKSLLGTAKQSKATFDQGLEIRRQELADAIAGGDQAKIERAQKNLDTINQSMRTIIEEIDTRGDTLEGFHRRMQALQEEQLAVTQEAERKREEAEAAREESVWLNSPFNPTNIVRWAFARGPDMLGVILVASVLLILIRRFVQTVARAMVGKGRRHRQDATTRADTLALSFGSAATMIIAIIAILLVFEAAGVDITTILGGAAILGVAMAFGAQNLMRDYFNGFIILIEDQYELNDLVTINNNITGRVERVSLRTTALRDLQGKLHFIPNGEIKSVMNRSYDWAQIVFNIRVSYKENVDRVMDEILSVAREVCAEPEFRDSIIDEPVMLGVDEFAEFGIIIKFILKTAPDDLFRIKRETLRRIKNRFDELGIEIPVPGAMMLRQ